MAILPYAACRRQVTRVSTRQHWEHTSHRNFCNQLIHSGTCTPTYSRVMLHAYQHTPTKGTTMKALASIFILTLSILGLTSCATETVQAPKAVATVEHVSDDLLYEDTTDPAPAPVSLTKWEDEVLAAYGLSLPTNTIVAVTPVLSCGPAQPAPFIGGCTYPATASTPITIVISPELRYTSWGEFVLMHELNHAMGNYSDECAADQYARDTTGFDYHAYDCKPVATEQDSAAPTAAPQVSTEPAHTATTAAPHTATQPTIAPTAEPAKTVDTTLPTVEPAPPAPTVPSIPPLTDACSEFEARAEDGSCVPLTFWDTAPIIPPHAEPNPSTEPDCDNLQLGDAHAGIGLVCGLNPAKP